jgi:hypothetical protein
MYFFYNLLYGLKSLKTDSDDKDRHKVMTISHDHLGQVRKKKIFSI